MDEITTLFQHQLTVLRRAARYHKKGEPLPLDLLVEADELGISVSLIDQPQKQHTQDTE